jgi:hypothetical protein
VILLRNTCAHGQAQVVACAPHTGWAYPCVTLCEKSFCDHSVCCCINDATCSRWFGLHKPEIYFKAVVHNAQHPIRHDFNNKVINHILSFSVENNHLRRGTLATLATSYMCYWLFNVWHFGFHVDFFGWYYTNHRVLL